MIFDIRLATYKRSGERSMDVLQVKANRVGYLIARPNALQQTCSPTVREEHHVIFFIYEYLYQVAAKSLTLSGDFHLITITNSPSSLAEVSSSNCSLFLSLSAVSRQAVECTSMRCS